MTYESTTEPGQITGSVIGRVAEQATKAGGGHVESGYKYTPESAAVEISRKDDDIETAKNNLSEAQNRFIRSFETDSLKKKQDDIKKYDLQITQLRTDQKQSFNNASMTLFQREWPDFAVSKNLSADTDFKSVPEISEELRKKVEGEMNALVRQARLERQQEKAGYKTPLPS